MVALGKGQSICENSKPTHYRKLIRLEFPRAEAQHFGNVAVVWSSYVLET